MFNYTICFIRREHQFLMINRRKKPAMGMWNGVGGKIKLGETPIEGVKRETYEETGIQLNVVRYVGNVILKSNEGNAGIYVFMADLPTGYDVKTPVDTSEGILDWKDIDWIMDKENLGIISNVKCYLPKILKGHDNLEHTIEYDGHDLLSYSVSGIEEIKIYERYINAKL